MGLSLIRFPIPSYRLFKAFDAREKADSSASVHHTNTTSSPAKLFIC